MSKENIVIKGIRSGIVIILNSEIDFSQLIVNLEDKLRDSNDFFRGAHFTISPKESWTEIEFQQLVDTCTTYGLVFNQALAYVQNVPTKETTKSATTDMDNVIADNLVAASIDLEADNGINSQSDRITSLGLSVKEKNTPCLLVENSLRSGQKINFDGNVTVLGDVNPGAEIIASGNIIVMGTLRGVAHAGAGDGNSGKIIAYRLLANQIRINDKISRAPDSIEDDARPAVPEIAKVTEQGIVIENYSTSRKALV